MARCVNGGKRGEPLQLQGNSRSRLIEGRSSFIFASQPLPLVEFHLEEHECKEVAEHKSSYASTQREQHLRAPPDSRIQPFVLTNCLELLGENSPNLNF